MLTFVKDNLDEMHGNSVWTKTKLREIKKIFTKIHSLVDSGPVISENIKLEAIDKLYGIDDSKNVDKGP